MKTLNDKQLIEMLEKSNDEKDRAITALMGKVRILNEYIDAPWYKKLFGLQGYYLNHCNDKF